MKLRNVIVAAAFALTCAPAFADVVSLSNVTASWFNSVPVAGITIDNTGSPITIRWGVPFPDVPGGPQSGYNFTIATQPIDFTVSPPGNSLDELIGSFNHLNFPVTGTTLQSVHLDINADISVNASFVGNRDFIFDFTHDETPNNDDPCKYGGANGQGVNINGCADKVTVASNGSLSETFMVGGTSYTLTVLGFSNGGNPVSDFLTIENQQNTADLFARVSAVNAPTVPEPASLALLGLGLLAAGFMRRRSNR